MEHPKRLEIFEQVKADYFGFLTSVLWRLTGDRDLFEEAMQYALLGIWQHIEKLNGSRIAGYIHKIALTANSKAWRKRAAGNGKLPGHYEASSKGPAETVDDIYLNKKVREAIARLPYKQSMAITLRFLQQCDYPDISRILGCSEATVRSHTSKALGRLKKELSILPKGDY